MSIKSGGGGNPDPTEEERALAEIGAKQYNDFVQRGIPLARKFSQILTDPSHAERLEGRASAGVASAFANEMRNNIAAGLATGAKAGSAGIIAAASLPALKTVGATGVARARARRAASDREQAGLYKLSAFGRGLSNDASLGLRSAASDATRQAIAEADANTREYVSALDAFGKVGGYVGGRAISELEAKRWYERAKNTEPGRPIEPPTPLLDFFGRI